jgi:hypothetical protein
MDQIANLGDVRQTFYCAYCGEATGTRDHVPSKILLDMPYLDNLPVVPACLRCNNGFSPDEEYFACLVACLKAGSFNIDLIERESIKKILRYKSKLFLKIKDVFNQDLHLLEQELVKGLIIYDINRLLNSDKRLLNVFYKLGKGYLAFKLNALEYTQPTEEIFQLASLSDEDRGYFESIPEISVCPEVGSRAMQRILIFDNGMAFIPWVTVQEGRYRYLATFYGSEPIIKIVIDEFIGCEMRFTLDY